MDLKEEGLIAGPLDRHWYYASKFAALKRMIADGEPLGTRHRSVLDVGAGSGFFSRQLLAAGLCDRAVCVDPGYESERDETEAGRPITFRRDVAASDSDLVLMMDVLEHVPDDEALVRLYRAKVAPGAVFVVTVPAFQFLWSGHDVYLEHYRRYTLSGIEAVLDRAGLVVERGCYVFGLLFPLVATMRLGARLLPARPPGSAMGDPAPPIAAALKAIMAVERPVMLYNRLAGVTAMVRARAP